MRRFIGRLLSFLRLKEFDDDLGREIDAHLALLQDEYEARGMSQDAARRAARVSLGGVEQAKALHRDARSFVWLEDARQDLAHGTRLLRRSPLFTLTAALSLAIGIGANTAVFAVANSLLFRPPVGVNEPGTLVDIGTSRGDGGLNPLPYATYLEIVRNATALSGALAQDLFPHVMSLVPSETATAERTVGQRVTMNFFSVLGARPAAGRLFSEGDGESGDVAVLDHDFWVRRFGRDPAVVGRVLRVNGRPRTIVGVASEGFQGTGMQTRDIWLSMDADKKGSVLAAGRLRPGGSVDQAARQIGAIGDSVARARGSSQNLQRLTALPYNRAGANRNLVAGFATAVMILVSLVLAVACANVAGVMLARSTVRQREMALRTALGAGRTRLVRQLLTETMVLFALGAGLGLMLARGLILLAPLVVTVPKAIADGVTLDWRVLTFVTALSFVAALASGLVPAFKGSKADPVTWLKEDTRSTSGRSRIRGAFVVAQIAFSILVVVLAGLFVRALRHAGAASPGFDPRGVEIATLDLSMSGDNDPTSVRCLVSKRPRLSASHPEDGKASVLAGSRPGPQRHRPTCCRPRGTSWTPATSGPFAFRLSVDAISRAATSRVVRPWRSSPTVLDAGFGRARTRPGST
jgi:predicted permease